MRRKPSRKLCCVIMISATVIYGWLFHHPSSSKLNVLLYQDVKQKPDKGINTETQLSIIGRTKTILITEHMWGYRFGYGRLGFTHAACPVQNCKISFADMSSAGKFDAVMVHIPPWKKKNRSLSEIPDIFKGRRPDQSYVFFSTEPPGHLPDLNAFDGYFNWTMSYLR